MSVPESQSVGGDVWGFDVWVHNAACAPGDPQPAHMYFFNLAKSKDFNLSAKDTKWLWNNVIKSTVGDERFAAHAIGIVTAVKKMNEAGYALKKINLGYNKYKNGIDLVFRHKKAKNYAFVEAKGSYSWKSIDANGNPIAGAKSGPKPDLKLKAMQGSVDWNLDRLGRSKSYYARYLETNFATAKHYVSFLDGKLMQWSLDHGGVLK